MLHMQQILPVDMTEILAITLGMLVVLIPIAGLTARFALKPTVEALVRLFEMRGMEETVGIMEQRLRLLESQVETMSRSVERMAEAAEFDQELRGARADSLELPEAVPEAAPAEGADDAAGEREGHP